MLCSFWTVMEPNEGGFLMCSVNRQPGSVVINFLIPRKWRQSLCLAQIFELNQTAYRVKYLASNSRSLSGLRGCPCF